MAMSGLPDASCHSGNPSKGKHGLLVLDQVRPPFWAVDFDPLTVDPDLFHHRILPCLRILFIVPCFEQRAIDRCLWAMEEDVAMGVTEQLRTDRRDAGPRSG